jgi:23S rRNA pseudouridine1911/1915/1917 synthase
MAVIARGKAAVTHYRVVARYADATLLQCRLETGRTHQIRVHLASIGHPIVGDPVYGGRAGKARTGDFDRQALHAQELGLVHPVSRQPMSWHAPMPEDMQRLIATFATQAHHG